jgi:predicted component of type VI protein secretion system
MKAELVPDNGDPPIPITRDVTVLGRREFCDIRVNDPSVSKRHCVLVKTDGLLVIRDLGTTNGTKVKGQRIRWAALLPDDRITVGSYKMRVYLGPDNSPGPSELARYRTNGSANGASTAHPADGAGARASSKGAPARPAIPDNARTPFEVGTSDEPNRTPVETPALARAGAEEDMNWQRLQILDEDDVIIDLD